MSPIRKPRHHERVVRDIMFRTVFGCDDLSTTFVSTATIVRTCVTDLPADMRILHDRLYGWSLWSQVKNGDSLHMAFLAGQHGGPSWLVIEHKGILLCDSRPKEIK